jgi:hypothetical protein
MLTGCGFIYDFFGESTKNKFSLEPLESVEVSVDSVLFVTQFEKSFKAIYKNKSNFAKKYSTDLILQLKNDRIFKVLYNKNTKLFSKIELTEKEKENNKSSKFDKGNFKPKYRLIVENISVSNLFINENTGKIKSSQSFNSTEYCVVKIEYSLIDDKENLILDFTTTGQESVTLFNFKQSFAGALIINKRAASGYISKELTKQMSQPKIK